MNQAVESLKLERLTGGNGGRYRWVSITSLLLSVGVILKVITPNFGGVTPNWLIMMYCLAILLSRPTLKQSLIIGVVVGCMGLGLSKSALPLANLISEPLGAVAAWLLIKIPMTISMNQKRIDLRPSIVTFVSTVLSGGAFVTTLKFALGLPIQVLIYVMFPVVLLVALVNSICAQIVYYPAKKLFSRLSGEEDRQIQYEKEDLEPQITSLPERHHKGIILDRCSYSFDGKKRALDEVSMEVPEGTFMVIAGASGAGKTTLAAAFSGLIPHVYGGYGAGRIIVRGKANREEDLAERAKTVGLVMEDVSSQLVAMTVAEEVAFALENQDMPEKEIKERVATTLRQVGLEGLEERPVNELSGGQRQRLIIAAALAQETPILVLDEPASALDPEGREDIYFLLNQLHKERKGKLTLVVLETDITQAICYADHLAFLVDGKMIISDSIEKALDKATVHEEAKTLLPQIIQIRSELEENGFSSLDGYTAECLGTHIRNQLVSREG